jgi:hypothetical protein
MPWFAERFPELHRFTIRTVSLRERGGVWMYEILASGPPQSDVGHSVLEAFVAHVLLDGTVLQPVRSEPREQTPAAPAGVPSR